MQCVIHYLMETAPGRTSSFIRDVFGTRLACKCGCTMIYLMLTAFFSLLVRFRI